jgi:hypothetical protein
LSLANALEKSDKKAEACRATSGWWRSSSKAGISAEGL